MKYIPLDDGGSAWEWEIQGWRFQAVAVNGSTDVTLYYREADKPEAYWEFHHNRRTEGRSTRDVAEQMFRSTAVAPLNIIERLRIKRTWLCDTGPHAGKWGVGLDVLYVTSDELAALRAAIEEVD